MPNHKGLCECQLSALRAADAAQVMFGQYASGYLARWERGQAVAMIKFDAGRLLDDEGELGEEGRAVYVDALGDEVGYRPIRRR